jgi:hypothetical protein
LAERYAGMTVSERLWAAGISDQYARLREQGDLAAMNKLLQVVELRVDEAGMHWSLDTNHQQGS